MERDLPICEECGGLRGLVRGHPERSFCMEWLMELLSRFTHPDRGDGERLPHA